ncbi:MAG: sensor histidine kinase [Terrimicrobiaceae bacterium]
MKILQKPRKAALPSRNRGEPPKHSGNGSKSRGAQLRAAELEDANKELEAFTYSVSHDLRAPLRHIMGFVEILQRDAASELSPTHQHHLATIASAAHRMAVLVEDLLVFSRISRSEMKMSHVSLGQLVKEAMNDLREETTGRRVKWIIQELPEVMADPSLMRQVLVNILSNAIKFTSKCEEAVIEIGCDLSRRGETILFIRDNGIGFDTKYAKKIFGVFERLHDGAEFEGTGIGLALVQRLIQRHRGRAWATGEPGKGATFYISIPSTTQKYEKLNT